MKTGFFFLMEYSHKIGVFVYTSQKKEKEKNKKQKPKTEKQKTNDNWCLCSHFYLPFRILNLDMDYQPEM